MLSKSDFGRGMTIFNSCGGPNADPETMEVWYQFLKDLDPFFFREAIKDLITKEKNLGPINFVAEILERSEKIERHWDSIARPFVHEMEQRQEIQRIINERDSGQAWIMVLNATPSGPQAAISSYEDFVPEDLAHEFYGIAAERGKGELRGYRNEFKIPPAVLNNALSNAIDCLNKTPALKPKERISNVPQRSR